MSLYQSESTNEALDALETSDEQFLDRFLNLKESYRVRDNGGGGDEEKVEKEAKEEEPPTEEEKKEAKKLSKAIVKKIGKNKYEQLCVECDTDAEAETMLEKVIDNAAVELAGDVVSTVRGAVVGKVINNAVKISLSALTGKSI